MALCKLLLSKPDMLLLDEPTNHLDAESVEWLEQFLLRYPGTVVGVTHDRYFLDNAAEWILELDRGQGIPWKGNYSSWLDQKQERLKVEESSESARQKALKTELEWVRQSPKARQAKSKARIARFEELNSQEYQKRNETNEIFIPVAERLGNEVIEFKDVKKSYGDRMLMDGLSFKVPAGAIVGIIGPNGAGKSTLFRMIAGQEKADSGEVAIGSTARISLVGQTREDLDNTKTVFDDVTGGADILTVGRFEMPSRAYLGRFNFKGGDQQKIVGNLSGGERGRLHLAKTLLAGGNVLLLDEPSNDLDVETLRALEDALLEFAGSVMVISHDRWFLDRIATHILAAEGDSKWDVLRRQLPGVRGRQEEAPRRRGREAETDPLQSAFVLGRIGPFRATIRVQLFREKHMGMGIIGTIVIGFIVGVLAKFLHPGKDNMGFILTIVLGIGGAFLARFIGQAVGFYGPTENAGFIASLIGAIVILVIYGAIAKKS